MCMLLHCAWNPWDTACTFTYTFDQFLVFSMIIFPPPLHGCLSEKEVQLECLFNGEIGWPFYLSLFFVLLFFSYFFQRCFIHYLFSVSSDISLASPYCPECQPFKLLTNIFHSFLVMTFCPSVRVGILFGISRRQQLDISLIKSTV